MKEPHRIVISSPELIHELLNEQYPDGGELVLQTLKDVLPRFVRLQRDEERPVGKCMYASFSSFCAFANRTLTSIVEARY